MNEFENHMKRIETSLRKIDSLGDDHIKIYTGEIRRELAQMVKCFGDELNHIKKDISFLDKNVKEIFASADSEELFMRNKLDHVMQLMEHRS